APVRIVEVKPQTVETGGVRFESKLEQVQADIYLKDFESSVPKVRARALDQIEKLSRAAAVGVLRRLLKAKAHDPIRQMEVLNALSSLDERGDMECQLFADYLKSHDASLRLAAIRAISKFKDEESFGILEKALKDSEPEVRRQALNLLFWTYGTRAASAALALLHDVDNHVRRTAIGIAAALKTRQAVSALVTALQDPSREIQKSASEALKKITGEDFGFKPTATEKARNEAVEMWKFWWRDNQATFGFKSQTA
ncbi:MAG: HEAT repeat domain-containing protein, partial [Candidatus Omnitrophica bacterium]|nr:HEAT repeat domain-containing protein [Candidatus Omnitrophota bacterium]